MEKIHQITIAKVWLDILEEFPRIFLLLFIFSIEYWFRCLDIDGDGILSLWELEFFYEETRRRLEKVHSIEPLPFTDVICQLLDVVKPRKPTKIRLADLKRSQMAPMFIDTFANTDKYLDFEQRDGAIGKTQAAGGDEESILSDWEKYAAAEYEILVAEESQNNGGTGAENGYEKSSFGGEGKEI